MIEFKLKAEATFYADNIDDAMKKLGEHFLATFKDGLDSPDIIESGEIYVFPVEEDKKGKDTFLEVLVPETEKLK